MPVASCHRGGRQTAHSFNLNLLLSWEGAAAEVLGFLFAVEKLRL